MRAHRAWIVAILMSACGAAPTFACSVMYQKSPQEIVAEADGIYHVRAARFFRMPESPDAYLGLPPSPASRMGFDVVATLKGPKRTRFQLPAKASEKDDFNTGRVPYDFVRREGQHGNCFA